MCVALEGVSENWIAIADKVRVFDSKQGWLCGWIGWGRDWMRERMNCYADEGDAWIGIGGVKVD